MTGRENVNDKKGACADSVYLLEQMSHGHKTREQILAEGRDYKRRRKTYRTKNGRKKPIEVRVLREIDTVAFVKVLMLFDCLFDCILLDTTRFGRGLYERSINFIPVNELQTRFIAT